MNEAAVAAELLDEAHPDTRDRPTLALPYRADVYWCHKVG
ncbi:MAG: hypothetical protein AVDCRST_MAG77-203 [uncultured Chloroflexi bacterium]|uniref:Uncharacterized protein n=1 Tax=uncultured Chloroflexota bacterium TaxID=166587 RepID=A0A6J4H9N6_9CHLR|nr:MAG: hypothetical protein AVDCRST_MAG77-203 [uncultured Chloroflexota bacterium]